LFTIQQSLQIEKYLNCCSLAQASKPASQPASHGGGGSRRANLGKEEESGFVSFTLAPFRSQQQKNFVSVFLSEFAQVKIGSEAAGAVQ
jgi:hypothetical protein